MTTKGTSMGFQVSFVDHAFAVYGGSMYINTLLSFGSFWRVEGRSHPLGVIPSCCCAMVEGPRSSVGVGSVVVRQVQACDSRAFFRAHR